MRALIVLESLVVVGLALLILLRGPTAPVEPASFPADRLILDAQPGEEVLYRADDGSLLEFKVDGPIRSVPLGPPQIPIRRTYFDSAGAAPHPSAPLYNHRPETHGIFPFLGAEAPNALDRVWVWRRIQEAETAIGGRKVKCWQVDCIDPALPPSSDAVVVWFEPNVPVFGILKFERNGRTYELVSSRPTWKGS